MDVQTPYNSDDRVDEYTITPTQELERLRFWKQQTELNLHFGTYEYDLNTQSMHWSDGVYRLFGYGEDRPVMTLEKFITHLYPDTADEAMKNLDIALKDTEDYRVEYDILTVDQVKKRIEVIGKKILDATGVPVRNIGIVKDITIQYAQQQTVAKAMSELQRSNTELEEFAYIASHDLQEPLRKITTFSDRLSTRFADNIQGEAAAYLDRICASADHMRILIDNLLEFSRISRVNHPFVETDLNLIVANVIADLDLVIEETGTTITYTTLPVIESVPSQMKQLFNNILSNAIKFRGKDAPSVISIHCEQMIDKERKDKLLPPGKYHKIEIADNGIGFDEEYATRIFQIFQRLHGKSEYPGSGIGLAICKKISDHHKGTISARSVPGAGAVFTIILPQTQSA